MKSVLFFIMLFVPLEVFSYDKCEIYMCLTEYVRDSVKYSLPFDTMWIGSTIGYKDSCIRYDCNYDKSFYSLCNLETEEMCNLETEEKKFPMLYFFLPRRENGCIFIKAYIYTTFRVRLELYFKIKEEKDNIYIEECERFLKI